MGQIPHRKRLEYPEALETLAREAEKPGTERGDIADEEIELCCVNCRKAAIR